MLPPRSRAARSSIACAAAWHLRRYRSRARIVILCIVTPPPVVSPPVFSPPPPVVSPFCPAAKSALGPASHASPPGTCAVTGRVPVSSPPVSSPPSPVEEKGTPAGVVSRARGPVLGSWEDRPPAAYLDPPPQGGDAHLALRLGGGGVGCQGDAGKVPTASSGASAAVFTKRAPRSAFDPPAPTEQTASTWYPATDQSDAGSTGIFSRRTNQTWGLSASSPLLAQEDP
eukprot:1855351-Pyramimonas_sp.AAC.1